MASCELCGKKPGIVKCQIEGTIMNVCSDCSRFGDVKGRSNVKIIVQEKRVEVKEPEYIFVDGYGTLVKNARERLKLNQEDFAKKISEHKSLIHQVESEHIKPSIMFARKLEKALSIKIVEEVKSDSNNTKNSDNNAFSRKTQSQGLTFGDLINRKK